MITKFIRTLVLPCLLPFAPAAADQSEKPDPAAWELSAAINAVRLVEQRPLLDLNPQLTAAAEAHAADMAERGYFDHKDPDGRGLEHRLTKAGYRYALALETIAAGERDPHLVLAGWLESQEHKRSLLNWNVRDIGVAHLYYASDPALPRHRHYWVVVLGLAEEPPREEIADAER